MPDQRTTEAAARIGELIRQALRLADEAELSLISIHLDEALHALAEGSA